MATMSVNQVASQKMSPYASTAANVIRTMYNQAGVQYEQPNFTYEYTTFRGNAELRVRRGVVMESK